MLLMVQCCAANQSAFGREAGLAAGCEEVNTRNLGCVCSQLSTSTACQRTAGHSHSASSEPEPFPAQLIQLTEATFLFMLQLRVFFWDKLPDCPSLPHGFAPQSSLTAHKPEGFRKNKAKDVLQKHKSNTLQPECTAGAHPGYRLAPEVI